MSTDFGPGPASGSDRKPLSVILVALIFAAVMFALGGMAIFDAHYVGKSRSGVVRVVDGTAAQWMGGIQVCFGALMLTIFMPSRKWALAWVWLCGVALVWCALRASFTPAEPEPLDPGLPSTLEHRKNSLPPPPALERP